MSFKSLEEPDPALLAKRGEGTRYALIMAGLRLFGERGLEATSTRMLAEQAGANVASIPYYFGNKEGLYKAVVEYIVKRVREHVGTLVEDALGAMQTGRLSRKEARRLLHKVLGGFATIFVESDEPKSWSRIIMREQANPSEAFDIFYEGQMKHVQAVATRLLSVCTGLDPDGTEVKLRAHALFGQILNFLVSRESVLRALEVRRFDQSHVELIHKVLAAHVDACLKAPPVEEVP